MAGSVDLCSVERSLLLLLLVTVALSCTSARALSAGNSSVIYISNNSHGTGHCAPVASQCSTPLGCGTLECPCSIESMQTILDCGCDQEDPPATCYERLDFLILPDQYLRELTWVVQTCPTSFTGLNTTLYGMFMVGRNTSFSGLTVTMRGTVIEVGLVGLSAHVVVEDCSFSALPMPSADSVVIKATNLASIFIRNSTLEGELILYGQDLGDVVMDSVTVQANAGVAAFQLYHTGMVVIRGCDIRVTSSETYALEFNSPESLEVRDTRFHGGVVQGLCWCTPRDGPAFFANVTFSGIQADQALIVCSALSFDGIYGQDLEAPQFLLTSRSAHLSWHNAHFWDSTFETVFHDSQLSSLSSLDVDGLYFFNTNSSTSLYSGRFNVAARNVYSDSLTGGFAFYSLSSLILENWQFTSERLLVLACNGGGTVQGNALDLTFVDEHGDYPYNSWAHCEVSLRNSHLKNFRIGEKHFQALSLSSTSVRFTGGSIQTKEVDLHFHQCIFERERANKNSSVSFLLSKGEFISCIFLGTEGSTDPSLAVPDPPVTAGRFSTGTFVDCMFFHTRGFPAGGLFAGPFAVMTISNTTFTGCSGTTGGAIISSASVFHADAVTLENCIAVTGGALSLFDVIGSFSGNIKNCTALSGSGGGVVISGNSRLAITDVQINGNALAGGGISVEDSSQVSITRALIYNATALTTGGAMMLSDRSTTVVTDTTFVGCSASSWGGAVYSASYANAQFNNCTFINNRTPAIGGAVMISDYSHVNVSHSRFASNQADSSGGALVYAGGSAGIVQHSWFEGNSAGSRGGGVAVVQLAHPALEDLVFMNNTANAGGGLSVEAHSLVVAWNLTIVANNALTNGGGILLSGDASMTCTFLSASNNGAILSGGAVYCGKYGLLKMEHTILSNNTATEGAGLCLATLSPAVVRNTTIVSNVADSRGGGVLCANGAAQLLTPRHTFYYTTFANNVALSGGGITALTNTGVVLQHCFLDHNEALKGAGILLADAASLTANFTVFLGNTALVGGGGLFAAEGTPVQLLDCVFENNTGSSQGGALVMQGPSGSMVHHCEFLRNSAAVGGAMLLYPGSNGEVGITIQDSRIVANQGKLGGGIAVGIKGLNDGYWHNSDSEIPVNSQPPRMSNFSVTDTYIGQNSAINGGGISIAAWCEYSDHVPVFGPNVTVDGNFASQAGGGAFYQLAACDQSSFNYTTFSNNQAVWAGANIGWYALVSTSTVCATCEFWPPLLQGYGTATGLATFPEFVNITGSGCPQTRELDAGQYSLSLFTTDAFGTVVTGPLSQSRLEKMDMALADTSDCYLSSAAQKGSVVSVDPANGLYTFSNISLTGKNGTRCAMRFSPEMTLRIDLVEDYFCSTTLSGCSGDQVIAYGSLADTCVPPGTQPSGIGKEIVTVLLLTTVLCLCIVVCIVYGLLLWQWKRHVYRRKKAVFVNLDIDDLLLEKVSLYELLSDPDITVIPWEQLEVGERIGVGASGIVSEGYWSVPIRHKENISVSSARTDSLQFRAGSLQFASLQSIEDEESAREVVTCERKRVAIKELHLPVDELDPDQLHEFICEIRLMNALHHESVVQFMGVAYDDLRQRLCLVTELMERGSLSDLLYRKGANLSLSLKLKLAIHAVEGMVYLHEQSIMHRDLKTQNLLVSSNWDCKISDFGISTVKNRTMTMTCIGTPLYMAPEVLQHSRYSEKADVFSFGIVLVELFTGRPAYAPLQEEGISDAQLMFMIVAEGLRPDLSELPQSLGELVADCLGPEEFMRPSFDEILKRLKRLQKKSTSDSTDSAYL